MNKLNPIHNVIMAGKLQLTLPPKRRSTGESSLFFILDSRNLTLKPAHNFNRLKIALSVPVRIIMHSKYDKSASVSSIGLPILSRWFIPPAGPGVTRNFSSVMQIPRVALEKSWGFEPWPNPPPLAMLFPLKKVSKWHRVSRSFSASGVI